MTFALAFLVTIGLLMLRAGLNVIQPRQWALHQAITDAYMTSEKALAQRLSFAELLEDDSPWPEFPATEELPVEFGRLPGGRPITGSVFRTRMPDDNNLAADGGTGTVETNPAEMRVWRVQSIAVYRIGGREYAKSRTVIRSQ